MDEMLRYFEEELALFGQYARAFRDRFPKPAGELHIAGETYEDPSVARLIQSVALLSARIHKRLDDDYPKFTESLLESLYPHYLRPLPAYSVARIVSSSHDGGEFVRIERGTPLRSSPVGGTVCQFRTVYPVLTGPQRPATLTQQQQRPEHTLPASIPVAGYSTRVSTVISLFRVAATEQYFSWLRCAALPRASSVTPSPLAMCRTVICV